MSEIPSSEHSLPAMEALRWPERDRLYRPHYGRCLTGVLPTLCELLGAPLDGFASLASYLADESPRHCRRVLLLCVDAFGFKELAQSQRLRSLYGQYGTWITSVFPSITSCALSSLYQGLPPARHGITGHIIWKDFPGALVNMLRMEVPGAKASLSDSGFDVKRWQRERGFLDQGPERSLPGYHLMKQHIVGSGLSTLIYGKTPLVGFLNPVEGFSKAARILTDLEWGWVGLYLDEVDTVSHTLTGDCPQMGLVVRHFEEALAWLAGSIPRAVAEETVLMVVADHGQSTIRERLPLYGEAKQWLDAHTRAVGNSGRVLHVYLEPRQERTVFAWLEEFIGGRGRVLTFDEAKALTGPPLDASALDASGDCADPRHEAWVRQSLGDLVTILDDGWNWQKRDPRQPAEPYRSELVSQHGSLSWNEMFVPLLCAPFTALLDA